MNHWSRPARVDQMLSFDNLTFWLRTKDGKSLAMTAENVTVVPLEADQSTEPTDFQEATVTYFQATKDGTTWTWPVSLEAQEGYKTFVASVNPIGPDEQRNI